MIRATSTSLACKSKPEVDCLAFRRCFFDVVRTATTSFACNSDPELVLYGVSTPFAPPPPSHPTASWRWFYGVLMQSAPLPPPLHAMASSRWFLYGVEMPFTPPSPPLADRSCSLTPFVHSPRLLFWHRSCVFNLPCMQERATAVNVANATLPTHASTSVYAVDASTIVGAMAVSFSLSCFVNR